MTSLVFTLAQLVNDDKLPGHGTNAQPGDIKKILTIIFTTVGALAVLLIVIAGLRYIAAQGEPTKVSQAKSAIFYALIGLVIAALADAIVTFALKSF
jgi:hypothetical protein